MNESILHIATLIPARNEECLLPRCITSIQRAQEALPAGISSDLIIAVDSSTDKTYDIARSLVGKRGMVLTTNAGNVGVARALAAETALMRYAGSRQRCWLANTDADCKVPQTWLLDQVLLAGAGAQAVAGIVDVEDFSEHYAWVADRFRETYHIFSDGTHPHVHGANLGMRADVYLKAGGWAELATAEDHDLWRRISLRGCRRQSVAHLRVVTSGRRIGRAPNGFAAALAAHNEAVA